MARCRQVRSTAFAPEGVAVDSVAAVEELEEAEVEAARAGGGGGAEFGGSRMAKTERPELGAAKVVVSGGRGLKSGDEPFHSCPIDFEGGQPRP